MVVRMNTTDVTVSCCIEEQVHGRTRIHRVTDVADRMGADTSTNGLKNCRLGSLFDLQKQVFTNSFFFLQVS